jgi:uncharacterized protein (DUF1800 family)
LRARRHSATVARDLQLSGGTLETGSLETDSDERETLADGPEAADGNVSLYAASLATALSLTACGGGGDGTTAPPPPPPILMTDAEASRFLQQAQFAATDSDIAALKTRGFSNWLDANFDAAPGQTGVAWLTAQGYNSITSEQRYFWPQFGDFMIWNQLLAGPDQVRKRMALALSEFFVVSLSPIDGFYPPYMIAAYWDVLTGYAFGNFRVLLEKITLNAAMGFFLNTRGNLKEDAASGRQPDENYAREVMQLFTIGLYELNPDGTKKTDGAGQPIETYVQDDVSNLARVFTGYDYDYSHVTFTNVAWVNYAIPSTQFATDPLSFNAANHSDLAATFLGTTVPANTAGPEALRIALDTLFNHPNVGPFFGRQMIQRLVTSNPSPAYVGRVASVFNNDGAGVRGNLRAVWKAILTDTEARTAPDASATLSGKLREPMVRLVQWARTVGINSTNGTFEIYDLSASDTALGQSALRSPSVFNFFRPGYVPPNTAIAANNLEAPEFQLLDETTTAGYINFLESMIRWGYNDVVPSYAALLPMAQDVPGVIAWLNLRLCANQLSGNTVNTMQAALTALGVSASSSDDAKRSLLAAACLMVMSCPEYLVQK